MPLTTPWTDDRIKILTKLWADGRSASAIARELGGVTRNAVIGKVHRLGLGGRATPARPGTRRPRAPKAERPAARLRRAPVPKPWPVVVEPVPVAGTADVISVGPHMCRWPIGDPMVESFALCGRPAVRGAYCASHGAIAYRAAAPDHLLRLAGLR
ncbi:MAG: GcrA cell cycle regulator [Phenylobacterium sp.]|uniref:GcrA family cell cycle regulator n=1 Tax=Phenylobacterium sp. TaxID=1871053 RepID=UPI001A1D880C|nr:GcrA family cell cycle regulator [Phenylobacterium sp.]MBJ7411438.1 GcrA cell cycle regulator [Phenylobacterium sp.]